MGSLVIVKPLRPQIQGSQVLARMLTPDPKEAVIVPDQANLAYGALLDFGAAVTIDTAFVGYHTAQNNQSWQVYTSDSGGNATALFHSGNLYSPGSYAPFHALARHAPMTSRYWIVGLYTNADAIGFSAGVLALGQAFVATYGAEWGAGRTIEDTGSAERLFGGGFGIDDGVAAGGYAWTFGDLNDLERRQLYQLVKDRRTTRSVLVVEDDAQTEGLNERIHWGLFRRLDAYERLDPLNTKWSLQIGDWA